MKDYLFVYRDAPGDTAGLEPLVRAANSESTAASDGFDYAPLYAAWVAHYGRPLPAWDYFYPGTHGVVAANVLLRVAPHAPYYVLDVEDADVGRSELAACVAALAHYGPVYLSTYGLISQADEFHVSAQGMGFAGIMPQVYFGYQAAGMTQWETFGLPVYPTFSPADYPSWATLVPASPCGIWRYGIGHPANYVQAIANARKAFPSPTDPGDDMPLNTADIDSIAHAVDVQLINHDGSMKATLEKYVTAQVAPITADLADIKTSLAALVAAAGTPAGAP